MNDWTHFQQSARFLPFRRREKKSPGREQDASAGLFSFFTHGCFWSRAAEDRRSEPPRCMMGKLHSAADLVTPVSNEEKITCRFSGQLPRLHPHPQLIVEVRLALVFNCGALRIHSVPRLNRCDLS